MTFCKMHRSKTRIAGNPCVRNRVELSPKRVELRPKPCGAVHLLVTDYTDLQGHAVEKSPITSA